jgi:hypothetical protein
MHMPLVGRNRGLVKPESAHKLEPQIEFLVGTFLNELAKHLDFTMSMSMSMSLSMSMFAAHVRTSLEPHLDPFTSCSFCSVRVLCAQSLLTARESHVLHLLACAGMAVNTHGVHIEQASCCWVLPTQLHPRSAISTRFRSAGAAGPLQAAGWCSLAVGWCATKSPPPTMISGSLSISVWWTFSSFTPRRDF